MANFPSQSVGGNSGNGDPLILGDQDAIGDLFTPGSALEILDWDGDGKSELVSSGGTGDITVFKYLEDTKKAGILETWLHSNGMMVNDKNARKTKYLSNILCKPVAPATPMLILAMYIYTYDVLYIHYQLFIGQVRGIYDGSIKK